LHGSWGTIIVRLITMLIWDFIRDYCGNARIEEDMGVELKFNA
jgi:hypothetical protein